MQLGDNEEIKTGTKNVLLICVEGPEATKSVASLRRRL